MAFAQCWGYVSKEISDPVKAVRYTLDTAYHTNHYFAAFCDFIYAIATIVSFPVKILLAILFVPFTAVVFAYRMLFPQPPEELEEYEEMADLQNPLAAPFNMASE